MSSYLYALDIKGNRYIGINMTSGLGTQTRNYSSSYINNYYEQNTNGSAETEYDISGINLKVGFITKRKDRIEISFSSITATKLNGDNFNINTNDTQKSKLTGIDMDYLLTIGENKMILPYLSLGYGVYKNNDIDGYNLNTGEKTTATGLSLNIGAGLISEIVRNIELEVSYRIKRISYNIDDPDIKESIKMAYLGINFIF